MVADTRLHAPILQNRGINLKRVGCQHKPRMSTFAFVLLTTLVLGSAVDHAIILGQHVSLWVRFKASVSQHVECDDATVFQELLRDDLPVAISPIRLRAHVRQVGTAPLTTFFCGLGQLRKRCLTFRLFQQVRDTPHLVPKLGTMSV